MLAGCAQSPGPVQEINLSGFQPAFQEGYRAGCSSATGGMNKDEKRYKTDSQYALGWNDGYDICKRKKP